MRRQMLRTSEEVKAVRLQYNADIMVIEALTDIRRSQWWRRPEQGGASSSTAAAGSVGSSGRQDDRAAGLADRRTRSPTRVGDLQTRAMRGVSPRQEGKGGQKGAAKLPNGWAQGGF